MKIAVRESRPPDLEEMLSVVRGAFGRGEEADLVRDLLSDPTAEPRLSLLAFSQGQAAGTILFSKAYLEPDLGLGAAILAPLAVSPPFQRQGIGTALIREGCRQLRENRIDLVFVLGSKLYYPRHGFQAAAPLGFDPPYPLPFEFREDWMVCLLNRPDRDAPRVKVRCSATLQRPQYWWS